MNGLSILGTGRCLPDHIVTNDDLAQNYPGLYQSLLQIVHNTGERVNGITAARKSK